MRDGGTPGRHLKAFNDTVGSGDLVHEFPGKIPSRFAAGLKDIQSEYFPDERFSRDDVYKLARSNHANTPTLCAAILAWGAMKHNHRDLLFRKSGSAWIDHCDAIRQSRLTRAEAYAGFAALRRDGKLIGMGVAYYTKLIHFLIPASSSTGCILDQWLGCSVNLLSGQPMIHMTRSGRSHTVSDKNDASTYEAFCKYIETLAQDLQMSIRELDQRLLSRGGRDKGAWRRYVLEHRQK